MSSRERILRNVNQLWSVLDDLAENDPKAYNTFIEKQKQGETLEPLLEYFSSLRTEFMGPKKGLLCINICGWKLIPAPHHPATPIPTFGGILEAHRDKDGDEYHVLDVAVNPTVLQKARRDARVMEQIYGLVLRFAQHKYGLTLSQQYTVSNNGLQANLEDMYRRIDFQQRCHMSAVSTTTPESAVGGSRYKIVSHVTCRGWSRPLSFKPNQEQKTPLTPAALLKEISPLEERQGGVTGPAKKKSNTLIQVVSSTYTPTPPQEPEHQLKVNPGTSVELTVALPKVRSISECQLSISQDDVLLVVEDLYHLLLELPIPVNEDSATAIFSKKSRMLTLTVAAL